LFLRPTTHNIIITESWRNSWRNKPISGSFRALEFRVAGGLVQKQQELTQGPNNIVL